MEQPSKSKRARPDEERDADVYYDDGSVVLSASDEHGNLVYFRVHKSVLSKHSPFFKTMFSLPSTAVIDLYDDTPLVHVHDEPKDLKSFLQMLYDPCFLLLHPYQVDTAYLVAGPLKLATKYQVDDLRARIITQLELDWPTTLQGWEKREDYVAEMQKNRSGDDSASDIRAHPEPVIRLALECDIPSVLPVAFYDLSKIRADAGVSDLVTREDLVTLMRYKEGLKNFLTVFCFRRLFNLCDRCDCDIVKYWANFTLMMWIRIDPLSHFRSEVTAFREGKHADMFCQDCTKDVEEVIKEGYVDLFPTITSLFA